MGLALWWGPVALLFAAVQLTDVALFGWCVYDHYTSWSVTFIAVFYIAATFIPKYSIYLWHYAFTTAHFVASAITTIIIYEPGHFMAISRESGAVLSWLGHIFLHLVPLVMLQVYTVRNRLAIRTALRRPPIWLRLIILALPVITVVSYVEAFDPAARYGTTLDEWLVYVYISVISLAAAEYGGHFFT